MPLPALIGVGALLARGALTAATVGPYIKPALGAAKRFLQRGHARPGIGSKVTRGKLKLGGRSGTFSTGPARPGTGTIIRAAGAAGAVGIGTVASHRVRSSRTAASSRPQTAPARSSSSSSSTKTGRKCCPAGTKRMVCYKRGRVKARLGSKASKWKRRTKTKAKRTRARTTKRRTTKRRTRRRR